MRESHLLLGSYVRNLFFLIVLYLYKYLLAGIPRPQVLNLHGGIVPEPSIRDMFLTAYVDIST